jgi:hypothetical protein
MILAADGEFIRRVIKIRPGTNYWTVQTILFLARGGRGSSPSFLGTEGQAMGLEQNTL